MTIDIHQGIITFELQIRVSELSVRVGVQV